ncbi:MAG: DUF3501 family protein [Gemmatimonas sp.]
MARSISRTDILALDDYAKRRAESRRRITALKEHRRISVGPYVTFYFENRDTMLHQIHEMLYIERGGEEQIADELAAYGPLVPNGRELVATMMIEIEDEGMRRRELARLGYIEDKIGIVINSGTERLTVKAVPEDDEERTTPEGKTSSVHFLHFPFDDAAIRAFRDPNARVTLEVEHPNYGHIAVMPADVKAALAADFD